MIKHKNFVTIKLNSRVAKTYIWFTLGINPNK